MFNTLDLLSTERWPDLRSYLNRLLQQSASNPDIGIHWPAISCENVRAVNHDKLAGLQIADAVASSMFFAANKTQYGEVEDRYYRILRKNLFRKGGRADGYGLKIWCSDDAEKQRLAVIASLKE